MWRGLSAQRKEAELDGMSWEEYDAQQEAVGEDPHLFEMHWRRTHDETELREDAFWKDEDEP